MDTAAALQDALRASQALRVWLSGEFALVVLDGDRVERVTTWLRDDVPGGDGFIVRMAPTRDGLEMAFMQWTGMAGPGNVPVGTGANAGMLMTFLRESGREPVVFGVDGMLITGLWIDV